MNRTTPHRIAQWDETSCCIQFLLPKHYLLLNKQDNGNTIREEEKKLMIFLSYSLLVCQGKGAFILSPWNAVCAIKTSHTTLLTSMIFCKSGFWFC